jgi:D-alanyl-lipoteichoic acid acyltransferase DltB (MBOAT superfamily)
MATNGMRQLLWGFFKKIVIANNCALLVNPVFENYLTVPGSLLLAGAFLYAIQLYADFSGYSDMALGIARLLGFSITRNFHFPFFSKNIAEYWQKWHISLTSWFTEYVFTPLSIAFRDYGKFGLILAIIINFTIVGAWHGANWTFVLFGFLHGCYFIPLVLQGKMMRSKRTKNTNSHSVNSILSMAGTFTLVALTLIVFRADSVSQALGYFQRLFSVSLFFMPAPVDKKIALITGMLVLFFLCVEWLGQKNEYAIERVGVRWPAVFRWGFYYLLLIMVLVANEGAQDFIYARF